MCPVAAQRLTSTWPAGAHTRAAGSRRSRVAEPRRRAGWKSRTARPSAAGTARTATLCTEETRRIYRATAAACQKRESSASQPRRAGLAGCARCVRVRNEPTTTAHKTALAHTATTRTKRPARDAPFLLRNMRAESCRASKAKKPASTHPFARAAVAAAKSAATSSAGRRWCRASMPASEQVVKRPSL